MEFLPGMFVTTVRFVCYTSPDPIFTDVSARLWSGLHSLIWSWGKESRGAALLFHGTATQTSDIDLGIAAEPMDDFQNRDAVDTIT